MSRQPVDRRMLTPDCWLGSLSRLFFLRRRHGMPLVCIHAPIALWHGCLSATLPDLPPPELFVPWWASRKGSIAQPAIAAAAPFSLRTIRPGETLKGACPPCHFPRNPCKHAVAFDSALASRTRREHPAVTAPRCTYRGIGSHNAVGRRVHVGLVTAPDRIAATQTESVIKACRNGRDFKRR
jgi:hypothetical protein